MKLKYILAGLFLLLLLLNGCSMAKIDSLKKTRELAIDGNDKDWIDAKYFLEDQNLVLGVMNDADYLYLCFYPTKQEQIQQFLLRGCTIWLNKEAKKKKIYGIQFPPGIQYGLDEKRTTEPDNHAFPQHAFKPENNKNLLNRIPREVEIIDHDKTTRFKLSDLKEVEIAINSYKNLFVYEIKIPLHNSEAGIFAIDAEPESEIALGIEVPKISLNNSKSLSDRSLDVSSERGNSGGRKGPRSRGERSTQKMPENSAGVNGIDVWLKIKLK